MVLMLMVLPFIKLFSLLEMLWGKVYHCNESSKEPRYLFDIHALCIYTLGEAVGNSGNFVKSESSKLVYKTKNHLFFILVLFSYCLFKLYTPTKSFYDVAHDWSLRRMSF